MFTNKKKKKTGQSMYKIKINARESMLGRLLCIFWFKNGPFLPLLCVTSFLNSLYECRILCATLGTNKHYFFSYDTDGDHTYHAYQVLYSSSSYCCRCILLQVPRSCCCTKRVMPLESSHGHHLPARAASARAARGRCVDPKRAATAP